VHQAVSKKRPKSPKLDIPFHRKTTPTFFLNPIFVFAYGLGLMHVTGSPPAKIWGFRPTGLGGVVVSASLALQQRIANDLQQPIIFIELLVIISSMSQRVRLQKLGGLGPLD
jgi:hypothetical protein